MPKVEDTYKEQMRQKILEAAVKACEKVPAYALTMRDVIRSSGLSTGAVYSYYRNIDDLWIDFLNNYGSLAEADTQTALYRAAEEPLSGYICRLLHTIGVSLQQISMPVGKIIFELEMKRATDPEFARKRKENVKVLVFYHEMLRELERQIRAETESGMLHPSENAETVLLFLQTAFDGILRDMILERCYGLKKNVPIDEVNLMDALAKSLCALLNIREV